MNFRELSYVMAIAKYKNITKAAESLYLTQPTLSKFLKSLESDVGQPLFRRLGNKYIPTYAGERYIKRAREILQLKKELDQEMGDIISKNKGVLKIGFPAMRGTYMLPCTLPIFRSLYPEVRIMIREERSNVLVQLIQEGEIDLAFFNRFESDKNIDYTVMSREELLLVTSKENPLCRMGIKMSGCKYPHMDLRLLSDQKIIMQVPGQRTRSIVDQLFKGSPAEPNIILETGNIQAEAELAARNFGVCFITETHLKHITCRDKLAFFSVGKPNTTVDFVAAYRTDSYIPYHAQEYMKIVKDFT
ncbi:MAG: LysR family transcriptional regulator [Stomatobaculum sp.]